MEGLGGESMVEAKSLVWKEDCGRVSSKVILIGKILTEKNLGCSTVPSAMQKAWSISGGLKVVDVRRNVFVFTLDSKEDAKRILRGRPWSVQGHLLCLQERGQYATLDEIEFNSTPIWVQLHNVPFEAMNVENIRRFGLRFGKIVMLEDPEASESMLRGFLRFRVIIKTNRALIAGFWIQKPDGSKAWAKAKYEKLPNFCFKCGCLEHESRSCNIERLRSELNPNEPQYGSWMSVGQARKVDEVLVVEDAEWFKSEGIGKGRKDKWKDAKGISIVDVGNTKDQASLGTGGKYGVHTEEESGPSVAENAWEREVAGSMLSDKGVQSEEGLFNKDEGKQRGSVENQLEVEANLLQIPGKMLSARQRIGVGEASGNINLSQSYVVSLPSDEEDSNKAIVPYIEREMIQEVTEKLQDINLKRQAEDELVAEEVKRRKIGEWPANGERSISLLANRLKKDEQKRKRVLRKERVRGGRVLKKVVKREGLREISLNVIQNEEQVVGFLEEARRLMAEGSGGCPLTATKGT